MPATYTHISLMRLSAAIAIGITLLPVERAGGDDTSIAPANQAHQLSGESALTVTAPVIVESPAVQPVFQEAYNDLSFESYYDSSGDVVPHELKGEVGEPAWTKDGFKIIPYGSLWGSVLYTTRRTFPGPYTLFVLPLNEEGEPDFFLDTRRTRLGLDVVGPRIPTFGGAESGGKVEIDFHGEFVVENRPGVLLRHAYGEIKDEEFRLLAGQTWDVISPLNPGVLSYSVLWAQGNIGYRRAQVRLERYLALPADRQLTLQFSLNQNIVSDFADEPGIETESVGWPLIQGRVALTDDTPHWLTGPATLGFSGHIGEQGFDFVTLGPPPLNLPPADDVRIPTWSLNVDLRVPVTQRSGIQGEFFMGET
jgi:hypothetical protein